MASGARQSNLDKMLQNPLSTATFCMNLGVWCYSWCKILFYCKATFCDRDDDILRWAPLAGQLIGLIMTNVLGVIHFVRAEDRLGVVLAALDLDIWLLAYRHGPSILKGEAPKQWEKLRLRTAIWRGVPLACIDYYLASRDTFEMPWCQATAALQLGLLRMGESQTSSLAVKAFLKDGLNPWQLTEVKEVSGFFANSSGAFQPARKSLLDLEKAVWNSCHCWKSTWQRRSLSYIQDTTTVWPFFYLIGPEDNFYGKSGYPSLFALNVKMQEDYRRRLRLNDDKLRGHIRSWIPRSGLSWRRRIKAQAALKMKTAEEMVDMMAERRKEAHRDSPLGITFGQSRWWGCMSMIMARFSLFSAALPIAAQVRKSRRVSNGFMQNSIRLHVIVDALLLVSSGIFMLQSQLASIAANLNTIIADMAFKLAPVILKNLNLEYENREPVVQAVSSFLGKRVPGLAEQMKGEVLKAGLPPEVCQKIIAVIAVFSLVSAVVAQVVLGRQQFPFGRCLNAAVCGPLYLLSHVEDCSVADVCSYITTLICLRGVLLTSMVAFAWRSTSPSDAEFWYAACYNYSTSYFWMCSYWLVFVLVHALTGFVAVRVIKHYAVQTLPQAREPEDVALESLSDAGPRGTDYRTFSAWRQAPSVRC
mmetsp:Transcript_59641/g.142225  ORF Transcript_59641/g.142225 Transcript_59641/m.142225 type:complete len:645 (-) Transcript_59641:47-1981(-)